MKKIYIFLFFLSLNCFAKSISTSKYFGDLLNDVTSINTNKGTCYTCLEPSEADHFYNFTDDKIWENKVRRFLDENDEVEETVQMLFCTDASAEDKFVLKALNYEFPGLIQLENNPGTKPGQILESWSGEKILEHPDLDESDNNLHLQYITDEKSTMDFIVKGKIKDKKGNSTEYFNAHISLVDKTGVKRSIKLTCDAVPFKLPKI